MDLAKAVTKPAEDHPFGHLVPRPTHTTALDGAMHAVFDDLVPVEDLSHDDGDLPSTAAGRCHQRGQLQAEDW